MGAENGNIPIGGTVAVLAQEPVGLMATAGARLRGAGMIIGVESVPGLQKLAGTKAPRRAGPGTGLAARPAGPGESGLTRVVLDIHTTY
jgi:hypothetical protein